MPSLYDRARELRRLSQQDTLDSLLTKPPPPARNEALPEIALAIRYEGQWVVGLPGTGKTQLLQFQILRDLDLVAAGKAFLLVLDPTGDEPGTLIYNLTRLKRFARGGDLHGKLVYIDPTAADYTLPINLFSLRANLNDEAAIGSAISSYMSIIGGLMGQPLTAYQDPVFRYAIQAALAFPNPTFATLCDIIAVPPAPARGQAPPPPFYEPVLHKLDPVVQQYFHRTYETEGPRRSRGEIMNRLSSLTADPTFRRLFTASETKIDFAKEINQPKVIVINANRIMLRTMTELYGRYFLALIKKAGEERPSTALPCFAYIDECDEFVAMIPMRPIFFSNCDARRWHLSSATNSSPA